MEMEQQTPEKDEKCKDEMEACQDEKEEEDRVRVVEYAIEHCDNIQKIVSQSNANDADYGKKMKSIMIENVSKMRYVVTTLASKGFWVDEIVTRGMWDEETGRAYEMVDEFDHWSGEFVKTIFSTVQNIAKQGDDQQMLLRAVEQKEVFSELNRLWSCATDILMNRAREEGREKAQRHLKIESKENKEAKIKDKQTEEIEIIKNDVKELPKAIKDEKTKKDQEERQTEQLKTFSQEIEAMKCRLSEPQSEDEQQSVEEEHDNETVDAVVENFVTKQVEEVKEQVASLTEVIVQLKESLTARTDETTSDNKCELRDQIDKKDEVKVEREPI